MHLLRTFPLELTALLLAFSATAAVARESPYNRIKDNSDCYINHYAKPTPPYYWRGKPANHDCGINGGGMRYCSCDKTQIVECDGQTWKPVGTCPSAKNPCSYNPDAPGDPYCAAEPGDEEEPEHKLGL